MHNERSGARRHHQKDEEVLSPAEDAALVRGQDLKRRVRAAFADRGVYDDTAIGDAVGVGRGAVLAWWRGSRPLPGVLQRIADATGLSLDELTRYVYFGGPLPQLPGQSDLSTVIDATRLAQRDSELEEEPDPPAAVVPAEPPHRPRRQDVRRCPPG